MRSLAKLALAPGQAAGLMAALQRSPRHTRLVATMQRYAYRLFLVKASGSTSTLAQVTEWAEKLAATSPQTLLVVDYLQKIPMERTTMLAENETTTFLAQGLKELAMTTGVRILAIAASDRLGLQAKRMRNPTCATVRRSNMRRTLGWSLITNMRLSAANIWSTT